LLKPVIEDRCDIGAGAVIAGAIRIGHDSQIGANAVVLKDVPPHSVAVGIPAKVIKTRTPGGEEPTT
jgi:serine O-acetyltransferase